MIAIRKLIVVNIYTIFLTLCNMEKTSIFQFKFYKSWLQNVFNQSENRGLMSRICRLVDCQCSYMSRVLNTKLQLTPDYAYKVSEALQLSTIEQEYFLLLVDIDRCTELQYINFLTKKMKKIIAGQTEIRDKIQRPIPQNSVDESLYFSMWYWSAIHLWCATPGHHTAHSMAKKFSLSDVIVEKCLEALVEFGFLKKTGAHCIYNSGGMHLDRRSPFAAFNHSNWRQKAVQDAQQYQIESSLHFTNLQTMTRADYQRIRGLLLEVIEKTERIARPSAPEELVMVCLDAFLVE